MFVNFLIAAVTLGLIALIVTAWHIAGQVIHQPREILPGDWQKFGATPELVRFPSADGTSLAGAFLTGSNRATVVMLHGYGDSKTQLLPQAMALNHAGFNIFLFDFRASGESGGEYITFGKDEQQDLLGAMRYLGTRQDVDHERVGLFGFSMGGSVALLSAGKFPEVRAVAVDSSYAEVKSIIQSNFHRYLGRLPFWPLGTLVLYIIKVRTGAYLTNVRPFQHVQQLGSTPLLIIHGTKDETVPMWDALRVHASASGPAELLMVPGAGHHTTRTTAGEKYLQKLVHFFQTHLLE